MYTCQRWELITGTDNCYPATQDIYITVFSVVLLVFIFTQYRLSIVDGQLENVDCSKWFKWSKDNANLYRTDVFSYRSTIFERASFLGKLFLVIMNISLEEQTHQTAFAIILVVTKVILCIVCFVDIPYHSASLNSLRFSELVATLVSDIIALPLVFTSANFNFTIYVILYFVIMVVFFGLSWILMAFRSFKKIGAKINCCAAAYI